MGDQDRIEAQARAAIEQWELAGGFVPRNAEQTAETLRCWAEGKQPDASPREVLRYALHFYEQGIVDEQRRRRDAEQTARRRAQALRRESLTAEMREIRRDMGMSMSAMEYLLGLKPGVIDNAERPAGSYGLDTVEKLLQQYRAHAQARGVRVAEVTA